MADEKKSQSQLAENLTVLTTPEGFQRYVLGTKKNGQPRAIYDIVKDYTEPKKKKKKKNKKKNKDINLSTYDIYLQSKGGKKKKKKKKKYWHI